jgi:hypothetical protein
MKTVERVTHTPGPWTLEAPEDKAGWTIQGPDEKVAHLYLYGPTTGGPRTRGEPSANARLIAAAPELLEALQKLVAAIDRMPANPADGLADDAREVIERATR